jgi:hypothetical protein
VKPARQPGEKTIKLYKTKLPLRGLKHNKIKLIYIQLSTKDYTQQRVKVENVDLIYLEYYKTLHSQYTIT